MGKITIQVEDSDIEQVERRVAEILANRIEASAGRKIAQEVASSADVHVKQIVRDRVGGEVEKLLREGWPEMSSYGEPTGKTWSLRAHVVRLLETESGDYGKRKKFLDAAIEKALNEAILVEFADVIAEAREKFRAAVNEVVKAKLAESLKAALGLR